MPPKSGAAAEAPLQTVMSLGDLVVDPRFHEVVKGGQQVELTRLQFRLLYALVERANCVVPYGELVAFAWGYADQDAPGAAALIKSAMSRLRRKLRLAPDSGLVIRSIPGQGYMIWSAVGAQPRVGSDSVVGAGNQSQRDLPDQQVERNQQQGNSEDE